MAGEKERHVIFLKEGDHLLIVLQGAVRPVETGLAQEVVMRDGNHLGSRILRALKDLLHPGERLLPDAPGHLVLGLIDRGIQHKEPVLLIDMIAVAQGGCVGGRGLVVTELMVDLPELLRVHRRRRALLHISVVGGGPEVAADVVVPGDDERLNAVLLQFSELLRENPVILRLAVEREVAGENHGRRARLQDLIDPGVNNRVDVLLVLSVVLVQPLPEGLPVVRHRR